MNRAQLLGITIERFKSFEKETAVEFAPLTVVLGRNNSGKSSLIQAILLLKQTLVIPRPEIPLDLDGVVSAINLRELTYGWPAAGKRVPGPSISLRWSCDVDLRAARQGAAYFDWGNFVRFTDLPKLKDLALGGQPVSLTTELRVETEDQDGTTVLSRLRLYSKLVADDHLFALVQTNGDWTCNWRNEAANNIEVEFDHFLPYLRLDRETIGPRHRERTYHNAFLMLFAQPIDALKGLLSDFQYLGATRTLPPALFKSSNVVPHELGASGELAAQLLHRRQRDVVHYLPPLQVSDTGVQVPSVVEERPLVAAVNDILHHLSVQTTLSVDDIRDIGFRILFGSANLAHVGRGLTYLLPLIELGLFVDPLRFQGVEPALSIDAYRQRCASFAHIAVEEPEAHLHPKVQSRLAHWMVSLAMSQRRLIVETHSDHLVRRLRGLVARAGAGSELEAWLLQNVVILEVEQDEQGRSTLRSSRLTAEGGIEERWPADFMDEASEEDSAIYYARLDKAETRPSLASGLSYTDEEEPDLEDMP